jgi:gamma-glutamyl-gamma-aminobutyrate hydrolase PuuD
MLKPFGVYKHHHVDHGGREDFNQALEKYLLKLAQNSLDPNSLQYFIALKGEIELPVELLGKIRKTLIKVRNENKTKSEVINIDNFTKTVDKFCEGPIAITYRNEGGGKGAFYDHHTLQLSTDHPTVIALDEEGNAGNLNQDLIKTFIRDKWTFGLSYGIDKDGKRIPDATTRPWKQGLLVVTGRERDQEGIEARNKYEQLVLRESLRRGQPILAICAGCWQLWKAFDGRFEGVKDHAYRQMINLSEDTGQVTYNKQIHLISIEQQSLLFQAMRKPKNLLLPVNSVHWKAPKLNKVRGVKDKFKVTAEDKFKVSATAKHDEGLAPFRNIKENKKMNVQENTIEAFECENGAPILGIQWHPEAYATDSEAEVTEAPQGANLALLRYIRYMAKAGDAYYRKIQMLAELKHKSCQVKEPIEVTEN